MQGGVVDEQRVGAFAVLSQSFAMISDDRHQSRLHITRIHECRENAAPHVVRGGHIPGLGVTAVRGSERLGWFVRGMGVIQVNPREPGQLVIGISQPLGEGDKDLIR